VAHTDPHIPASLDAIRRLAVQGVHRAVPLERALDQLGFVQADPIRAPARAQDLTLRPRVTGYRAGDLDRRYQSLPIEEDTFINYGYVTRTVQALMHPRAGLLPTAGNKRARAILDFIRKRGSVHPREVDAVFDHGRVTNYWGGSSSATTHLLEAMHYKGLLRVARREAGIRVYALQQHGPAASGAAERHTRLDALADIVVRKYAPLPAASLSFVLRRLRYAVPQWDSAITGALDRARQRLAHTTIDGHTWYWPPDQPQRAGEVPDEVRLLAPFDPVVWDRRRFEMLWGWEYRFEAYTPAVKRKLGYYALPLLWRDRVIGWANLSVKNGSLDADVGFVKGARPRDRGFSLALEAEIERVRTFLGVRDSRRIRSTRESAV
jgi:uncharacterized protein YcaQ